MGQKLNKVTESFTFLNKNPFYNNATISCGFSFFLLVCLTLLDLEIERDLYVVGTLEKLTTFEPVLYPCHGFFYFDWSTCRPSIFDSPASEFSQVAETTGLWHQARFCFYLECILKQENLWEKGSVILSGQELEIYSYLKVL